jgi:hypothetical protein
MQCVSWQDAARDGRALATGYCSRTWMRPIVCAWRLMSWIQIEGERVLILLSKRLPQRGGGRFFDEGATELGIAKQLALTEQRPQQLGWELCCSV